MKKTLINKNLLVVFLLLVLLTGCSQSTEAKSNEVNNGNKPNLETYLPLDLGNKWKYLGEGMEFASFTREVTFEEGNKVQTKEDNGGTVTDRVYEITNDSIKVTFMKHESYDQVNYLQEESNYEEVLLMAPIEVGTKWETNSSQREIVDLDASLETPAGSFDDLIKVQIEDSYATMYEYYKEGIGLVKSEFVSEGNEITSSLEEYEIK